MPLAAGQRLGNFEILSPIGAGGMGEVYKARDHRLERDVALKVLPEQLAEDATRLARLEREAKSLAAIEHPNIASLYSLEDHDRIRFFVMELVSGQTLAERLERGPIPFHEALPLFLQIGEALEAAHGRGILHRDLKPGNLQITDEGRVKVLDFGLAKSLDEPPESSRLDESPTRTKATEAGTILGTASYMSPEQARGKPLDKRSDIWSFGCVVFETLTGRRAFDGDNVTDVLASIVKSEPDWVALPRDVPGNVRRLLRRCLAKKPEDRLRDIGDAVLELKDPVIPTETAQPMSGLRTTRHFILGAVVGVLVASLAWSLRGNRDEPSRSPVRLSMTFPIDRTASPGTFDVSPDGRILVYGSSGEIYVRPFDSSDVRTLDGVAGATAPFFSPDARWVGFGAGDALYKIPVDGGRATKLASVGWPVGARWGADGFVYYSETYSSGILRVPAAGGDPELLTRLAEGDLGHWFPCPLPGGDALLYTVFGKGSLDTWEVRIREFRSGETRPLVRGGYNACYIGAGYLLFGRSGNLMAVAFDPESLELHGEPFTVQENVWTSPVNGGMQFAVSQEGTFLYAENNNDDQIVWVDGNGTERPASLERRGFQLPRSSPDGTKLAVVARNGIDRSIWLVDQVRGAFTRLTYGNDDTDPVWSPDGDWLYFTSAANGPYELFRVRTDGSGEPELLLGGPIDKHASSVSPDGGTLAYVEQPPAGQSIHLLSLDTGESRRLAGTTFREGAPAFSPGGVWILYESNESGRWEVYARRSDGHGAKIPVSVAGGRKPAWSRKGDQIFFVNAGRMFGVTAPPDLSEGLGQPREMFDVDAFRLDEGAVGGFDVGPDGEFAMVRTRQGSRRTELKIVLNWFDELRRLDPAN